jgi:hypothetical protein
MGYERKVFSANTLTNDAIHILQLESFCLHATSIPDEQRTEVQGGQSNHTPVEKTNIVENQVGEGGSHEDVVTNEQKTEVHSECQRNPSDQCGAPVVPLDQEAKDGSKMENGLPQRATVQGETQQMKLNLAAEDMVKAPTTPHTADVDSKQTNNRTVHYQKSLEAKSTIITGDVSQARTTEDLKLEKIQPGSSTVEAPDRSPEDASQTNKNETPQGISHQVRVYSTLSINC